VRGVIARAGTRQMRVLLYLRRGCADPRAGESRSGQGKSKT
jgi:hypothetical protein